MKFSLVRILVLFFGLAIQSAYAATIPTALKTTALEPSISAKSWVILEQKTGWVVAQKNADMRIEPASLTKLMTAYIVFNMLNEEQVTLQDIVTIGENARYVEGSRMFVELGSKMPLIHLLKGMMIQSGNDASIALAEHIDGSESAFVMRMNEAAKSLGMVNSQFKNVTGLPAEGHFSSARDIALLSRSIIDEFPQFYRWFKLKELTHNNIRQPNRNRLLARADWIDGLKTGYTDAAGYCLAASGEREGNRFISVVTGTNSDFQRTRQAYQLLNYAFANYKVISSTKGDMTRNMPVYGGDKDLVNVIPESPLHMVVAKTSKKEMRVDFALDDHLIAPVGINDDAGIARVYYGDQLIGVTSMQSAEKVALGSLFKRIGDRARLLLSSW